MRQCQMKVVARNANSGGVIETVSSAAGVYLFPAMPSGVYTVSVENTGFKMSSRQNVEIRVGQRIDMDVVLSIGDVTQSVDVTADVPLLETSTSERGPGSCQVNDKALARLRLRPTRCISVESRCGG